MSEAGEVDPLAQVAEQLRAAVPGIPDRDIPRFVAAISTPGPYVPCAESVLREGVAPGVLRELKHRSRRVYPGVTRDARVYLPAGHEMAGPLALMVFQDGLQYLSPLVVANTVLDNLIAAGEIPPCVAIFAEPGEPGPGLPLYGGTGNRSIEYDSLGDAYACLLIEELVPACTEGLSLWNAPAGRAIVGLSSGGICALNAAWERPDYFSKVVSHCGSFVNIRGGDWLSTRVRQNEARPLRVFLQGGHHDLDIHFGCWPIANRLMGAALAYRGYDYQLVMGEGGHSLAHGGALFADTLRWLWRDWREARAAAIR